jgi:diaminohydroxyphosphoribosylaminopyrimidine deaminase/5-amino-6-(5-phosphoribosylamino)uracil reductase
VIALIDPFEAVAGKGLTELRAAGLQVDVGVLEDEARSLNAPYLKLLLKARPWVIAKWAMSLDGKLATRALDSRWISSEPSRRVAHELRARVDAVMVGSGTALADDPLLTARPSPLRTATRIVFDSRARLSSQSQLARTAREVPVLVAVGPNVPCAERARLESVGCEVFVCDSSEPDARLDQLLAELGRRRMTNLLVEGGGTLLGRMFDQRKLDEIHVFIAPLLVGGASAPVALAGMGVERIAEALRLAAPRIRQLDDDIYLQARTGFDSA